MLYKKKIIIINKNIKKIAIQLPIFHSSIDVQNNFNNLCITVGGQNLQNPVTILYILKNCDWNLTFAVVMVNDGACFRVKCWLYLAAIFCLIPMKNDTRRELHTMTNYGKCHANWLTHTRVITSRQTYLALFMSRRSLAAILDWIAPKN